MQTPRLCLSVQRDLWWPERILDYGPLGVELKRNIKEAWWRDMITGHDDLVAPPGAPEAYEMVGLDCAIIMHPTSLASQWTL